VRRLDAVPLSGTTRLDAPPSAYDERKERQWRKSDSRFVKAVFALCRWLSFPDPPNPAGAEACRYIMAPV
jgi:hypothetical protein